MLLFIHDSFKLDLTYLQVSFSEQNPWFRDDITKEISFPFPLSLKGEFAKNSEFSAHYNAVGSKTVFTGILDRDGELVPAKLKIQNYQGEMADAMIIADRKEFSNFSKKLSELPLEHKSVADLEADAIEVLELGYPDTNYFYPMVHTDKYNPDDEDWNGFEKIINKYVDGEFVENVLEPDTNIDQIKNIIQPMPFLLHVLKAGFQDIGMELAGDILADPDFKHAVIFRDGEYFKRMSEEGIPFRFKNNEWDELAYVLNGIQHVTFIKELTVDKKGDYLLFGDIFSLWYRGGLDVSFAAVTDIEVSIEKISGATTTEFYSQDWGHVIDDPGVKKIKTYHVDEELSLEIGDTIRITKTEPRRDSVPSETPDYPEAISLELIPVRYREADGTPIMSVLPLNEVDLRKVVPDMTFGEVVTAVKNWKNYSLTPSGTQAVMNLIEPQIKSRSAAIDLSEQDIDEPVRTPNEDRTFELTFKDGKSNATYKYDSVFVSSDGSVVNDYTNDDNTSVIGIEALPLPVVTRDGINTAHAFEDETSKLRILFVRPMPENGSPVAYQNDNVLIPAIYENNYQRWINFRVWSIAYNWEFIISVERFREITIQSMIFAYKNYHLFTEIEKERIDALWWRVTAKTESLP